MPGQIYKNKSKLQQYWSLARGVTGVQRIPCTRDQQCGKHIIEKMIKTFWTKYYTLSISLRLGMTWCWTQYKGRMLNFFHHSISQKAPHTSFTLMGKPWGTPCETFGEDLPHTVPALWKASSSLQWRHNGRDAVWNHCRPECVFNRPLRCGPRNTSKLRVTGTCEGNSPVTGEFPAQRASNAENVSIPWCHHDAMMLRHPLKHSAVGNYAFMTHIVRSSSHLWSPVILLFVQQIF